MPRVNKIVQYGLENEVLELFNIGFTQDEIVNQLKSRHPEIEDLKNLSSMSISRFRKGNQVKSLVTKYQNGEDPEESLRAEFRSKMMDLEENTIEVYKIMRDALKRIVQEGDNDKIIKSAKDTLFSIDQSRKNWNTLIEQAYHQFGFVKEAQQTNYIQVNNQLVDMSRELCIECRKKIVDLVLLKEDKEKSTIEVTKEI